MVKSEIKPTVQTIEQYAQRKAIDWPEVRKAFLDRSPTPSYTELSKEFGCTPQSVSNVAREENWPAMREEQQARKLREANASEIVLKAVECETAVIRQARNVLAQFITAVEIVLQSVVADADAKDSTRANTLNTLGFALANAGKFGDSMGLMGMAQALRNSSRNDPAANGGAPWDKGMLQQINVTVQNLQAQAKEAEKVAKPAEQVTEETA